MNNKVLLVEDNPTVCCELKAALEQAGYEVTTANNGLDGYNKVQKHRFALCVVDHLMPLMNGPTFLKNIHAMGENAPKAVIFLTTQDLSLVEQLPEMCMADIILPKPVSVSTFMASLDKVNEKTMLIA